MHSLIEKEMKVRKDLNYGKDEIPPGIYSIDDVLHVRANLTKAPDTEVAERFDYGAIVRTVLLLYASRVQGGAAWLELLFGDGSEFIATLCTPEKRKAAEAFIDADLAERWDRMMRVNKERIEMPLVSRSGTASVVGTIAKHDETSA